MRIIYFGSSEFGLPCLDALADSRHELVGVFTQPARPSGRHRSSPQSTPVAEWSQAHQVPCVEAANINAPDMQQAVADCRADLLVVIAFGQKIGQDVIALQKHRAVNVHASLLPKYRGAAPIHWAIMNGETVTGVSIITLADTMDAGQILAQGKTPISQYDTFETMHETLSQLSVPVLMEAIEQLENGTAVYMQQDPSQVTYAPKLQKANGYIDWNKSAEAIVNQIRGLWPWPSAQSVYVSSTSGRHWRIIFSKACTVERQNKPDDIVGQLDEHLQVICGSGALNILELKPAGSHRMDFDAFVNGHQCRPGDLFISAEKALSGLF